MFQLQTEVGSLPGSAPGTHSHAQVRDGEQNTSPSQARFVVTEMGDHFHLGTIEKRRCPQCIQLKGQDTWPCLLKIKTKDHLYACIRLLPVEKLGRKQEGEAVLEGGEEDEFYSVLAAFLKAVKKFKPIMLCYI